MSVVVPTHQRRASVGRLLEALTRQDLAASAFEVIIAIDGSEDGTRELVESFRPQFPLQALWHPNRGRSVTRNVGVAAARGELLVILDDDMEPWPGCLSAHLQAHADGARRCVVGAAPITADVGATSSALYIALKFNEHLERIREPGRPFAIRDFYSGNMSLRRELLAQVGGFDESFRRYGNEDLELALRLRNAGVALVFDPAAGARQHHAKAFPDLAADARAEGWTAVQFAAKHPDAFAHLQLGGRRSGSPAWRVLRAFLLTAARRSEKVPASVIACTLWLERRGLRRVVVYFRHVLEYFFWLGAEEAMAEPWAAQVRSMFRGGS